jgi:hypothetical protein
MKTNKVKFAQLRHLLEGMDFEFTRLPKYLMFEHKKSNTLIMLRLYRANEALGEADFKSIRGTLDYGGFIESDDFEPALLAVKV